MRPSQEGVVLSLSDLNRNITISEMNKHLIQVATALNGLVRKF